MSLLAAACVFGPAIAAAASAWLFMERQARREAAAPPRKPVGDRYVAAPGFPQPEPGPGPDIRYAVYPPGSLGGHPETPGRPGPLAASPGDVEDLLTGALRLLRAEADR